MEKPRVSMGLAGTARSLLGVVIAGGLVAGCAASPAEPHDPGAGDDGEPPFVVTDPTDDDGDGIPEQLEDYLMTVFGPELVLAPDDKDWTRPASVDWYLPRVHMRFDQSGCPDDQILERGKVTFSSMHAQQQAIRKSGTGLCRTSSAAEDMRFSAQKHLEFFLQATDDAETHPGIPVARKSEWRAYTQVRPSTYVRASDGKAAAYDLQVWYFFPYNDWIASANHEADWEHVTISIAEDLTFVSAFYATHKDGLRIDDAGKLDWVGTHPVGYVADGSHATYPTIGKHATGYGTEDNTYGNGPRWETWTNFVNLGQRDHILNGQDWARYGGRWGEVGMIAETSGPPGPMFNGKWDTRNEYPK
jgi:hypothetical protein